jgi:hypothetical protein
VNRLFLSLHGNDLSFDLTHLTIDVGDTFEAESESEFVYQLLAATIRTPPDSVGQCGLFGNEYHCGYHEVVSEVPLAVSIRFVIGCRQT